MQIPCYFFSWKPYLVHLQKKERVKQDGLFFPKKIIIILILYSYYSSYLGVVISHSHLQSDCANGRLWVAGRGYQRESLGKIQTATEVALQMLNLKNNSRGSMRKEKQWKFSITRRPCYLLDPIMLRRRCVLQLSMYTLLLS